MAEATSGRAGAEGPPAAVLERFAAQEMGEPAPPPPPPPPPPGRGWSR
jgi:hypothetical protein